MQYTTNTFKFLVERKQKNDYFLTALLSQKIFFPFKMKDYINNVVKFEEPGLKCPNVAKKYEGLYFRAWVWLEVSR